MSGDTDSGLHLCSSRRSSLFLVARSDSMLCILPFRWVNVLQHVSTQGIAKRARVPNKKYAAESAEAASAAELSAPSRQARALRQHQGQQQQRQRATVPQRDSGGTAPTGVAQRVQAAVARSSGSGELFGHAGQQRTNPATANGWLGPAHQGAVGGGGVSASGWKRKIPAVPAARAVNTWL